MSGEIHIVVDANLPKSLVRELSNFWRSNYPRWTIRHENDVAKSSSPDTHWITKLRKLKRGGRWLIITTDKGRSDSKESQKLPYLCKKHDHAYIVLSELVRRSEHFKAAISSVWPEFPHVVEACEHLKYRPAVHVKLGQATPRGVQAGYKLQILGSPVLKYLTEKNAEQREREESFQLSN